MKNIESNKDSAPKDVIEKFKRIVLTKHGKLELSVEEEDALRALYKEI